MNVPRTNPELYSILVYIGRAEEDMIPDIKSRTFYRKGSLISSAKRLIRGDPGAEIIDFIKMVSVEVRPAYARLVKPADVSVLNIYLQNAICGIRVIMKTFEKDRRFEEELDGIVTVLEEQLRSHRKPMTYRDRSGGRDIIVRPPMDFPNSEIFSMERIRCPEGVSCPILPTLSTSSGSPSSPPLQYLSRHRKTDPIPMGRSEPPGGQSIPSSVPPSPGVDGTFYTESFSRGVRDHPPGSEMRYPTDGSNGQLASRQYTQCSPRSEACVKDECVDGDLE